MPSRKHLALLSVLLIFLVALSSTAFASGICLNPDAHFHFADGEIAIQHGEERLSLPLPAQPITLSGVKGEGHVFVLGLEQEFTLSLGKKSLVVEGEIKNFSVDAGDAPPDRVISRAELFPGNFIRLKGEDLTFMVQRLPKSSLEAAAGQPGPASKAVTSVVSNAASRLSRLISDAASLSSQETFTVRQTGEQMSVFLGPNAREILEKARELGLAGKRGSFSFIGGTTRSILLHGDISPLSDMDVLISGENAEAMFAWLSERYPSVDWLDQEPVKESKKSTYAIFLDRGPDFSFNLIGLSADLTISDNFHGLSDLQSDLIVLGEDLFEIPVPDSGDPDISEQISMRLAAEHNFKIILRGIRFRHEFGFEFSPETEKTLRQGLQEIFGLFPKMSQAEVIESLYPTPKDAIFLHKYVSKCFENAKDPRAVVESFKSFGLYQPLTDAGFFLDAMSLGYISEGLRFHGFKGAPSEISGLEELAVWAGYPEFDSFMVYSLSGTTPESYNSMPSYLKADLINSFSKSAKSALTPLREINSSSPVFGQSLWNILGDPPMGNAAVAEGMGETSVHKLYQSALSQTFVPEQFSSISELLSHTPNGDRIPEWLAEELLGLAPSEYSSLPRYKQVEKMLKFRQSAERLFTPMSSISGFDLMMFGAVKEKLAELGYAVSPSNIDTALLYGDRTPLDLILGAVKPVQAASVQDSLLNQ